MIKKSRLKIILEIENFAVENQFEFLLQYAQEEKRLSDQGFLERLLKILKNEKELSQLLFSSFEFENIEQVEKFFKLIKENTLSIDEKSYLEFLEKNSSLFLEFTQKGYLIYRRLKEEITNMQELEHIMFSQMITSTPKKEITCESHKLSYQLDKRPLLKKIPLKEIDNSFYFISSLYNFLEKYESSSKNLKCKEIIVKKDTDFLDTISFVDYQDKKMLDCFLNSLPEIFNQYIPLIHRSTSLSEELIRDYAKKALIESKLAPKDYIEASKLKI